MCEKVEKPLSHTPPIPLPTEQVQLFKKIDTGAMSRNKQYKPDYNDQIINETNYLHKSIRICILTQPKVSELEILPPLSGSV